jgi:hypothetical protein
MSDSTTLVFPAVGESAFRYLRRAVAHGERVIGAASVAVSDFDSAWGRLQHLPSIHEPNFEGEFVSLLEQHGIKRVYCPVSSVHDHVRRLIQTRSCSVELVGMSPIREQMSEHYNLMRRARAAHGFASVCSGMDSVVAPIEVAGVLRQAGLIYGESNDDKLAAVIGVFASAPQGDVVEVGSLMGRSAFVLRYLSWRYAIGAVLTVDPWSAGEAVQHQSPKGFQSLVDEWDFEVLAEGFFVNMIPLCSDNHAHLRMTSERGHDVYTRERAATALNGKQVGFLGGISVLHIDGNHDFDAVRLDCELWLPHLQPHGWLVLDDYIWAHGDGPYRVGNSILEKLAQQIDCSFVAGKALFVRFNSKLTPAMITAALAG